MTNEQIIKAELEQVAKEAIALYRASGKRVTGNWEKGIDIRTSPNKGELWSFAYLAGRGPTREGNKGEPTLVQRIEQWLRARGIKPIEEKMTISSLAFVIARKIHREGTNKENHRQVFEEILTPQRIQKIINRVGEFNVGIFVNDARALFTKISNNV